MTIEPSVSVLIANLDGRVYLGPCLDSLLRQDYPPARTEIVMVDNGSWDDSVSFVRERYPSVHIIEAGENLGFAGGNNLAARAATGEYLALINNDAQAAPAWLRTMLAALERDPEAACVAARLLTADGSAIDYVRTAMSPAGRAFQVDEGLPTGASPYGVAGEVFAPCGGGMLIRRDVFWAVGGFDEGYIAYYEDVDLGWRMWLQGYKVIFEPEALVYHRRHETGARIGSERRTALAEANALRTIIKNYDDENLLKMLPLSLLLGVKRCLEGAHVDLESYRFHVNAVAPGEPESIPRDSFASLVAIDMIAEELPGLLEARRSVQGRRVRSDGEIFDRFPLWPYNPLFPWRRYNVAQDRLLAAFAPVPQTGIPQRPRLLIITHETLGSLMAGPAIRAWELSRALAGDFEVTLAAGGKPSRSSPGLHVVGFDPGDPNLSNLAPFVGAADVIMVLGALLARYPLLQDLGKPVIVDLYDPYEFERLSLAEGLPEKAQAIVNRETEDGLRLQSLVGDFYVCANERQRDLWLGVLLATGRVNTTSLRSDPSLRNLIDVVPFGVAGEPPGHSRTVMKAVTAGIGRDDPVLLWNGGLWDWLDPLTLVEAMPLVLAERSNVKLWFAAAQHFDAGTVPQMRMAERVTSRCRELGLLDRSVFFGTWIPYDERGDYLLEADLGVSMHPLTLESHFASRTRLLDCFWAGLPVVVSAGDPLADIVEAEGVGFVVPPGDPEALARAILSALADETLRDRVMQRAAALCARLSWSKCAAPIARFVSHAAFAPDALEVSHRAGALRRQSATAASVEALQASIDQLQEERSDLIASQTRLRQELEAMTAHLDAIRRGRVMRLFRAVNVLLGRDDATASGVRPASSCLGEENK